MPSSVPYPKRLIEVDLPIKRISAHARREKSIRHGHISTLHIWWARRPLAACRAVICASLWPDPADPNCPQAFREAAAGIVAAFAARAYNSKDITEMCDPEAWARYGRLTQRKTPLDLRTLPVIKPDGSRKPAEQTDLELLRTLLLDFIADFAAWESSTNLVFLETSRALTQAAHEALGGEKGTRPLVVDPFAGGGSIPLEALRVGAEAFASDLNPVAVLLNKVVLEYIPRFGDRLADIVEKWGRRVQIEAEESLGDLYPAQTGDEQVIAYLWARTVISESPGDGLPPVEVPLLRSMWLAKSSGSDRALRWARNASGNVVTRARTIVYADGEARSVRQPQLEIFAPKGSSEVGGGTVARGSVTCPVTGFTTPVTSVRKQLSTRRGGASDARLLAVRHERHDTGRTYRLPINADEIAVVLASKRFQDLAVKTGATGDRFPTEPLPPEGGLGFRVQKYGIERWVDAFTPRQAVALTTLIESIHGVGRRVAAESPPDLAEAVQVCLGIALSRLTDFCSSLCTLNATGNRGVFHTFARHAMPIVWDFMESNPINKVGANWLGSIDAMVTTIRNTAGLPWSGQAVGASATRHPLPDDSASLFLTDPPYYDAVPYSDLSDYFYVWLRRSLPSDVLSSFGQQQQLTPKDDECIVDRAKRKDSAYFERTIGAAMAEGRRVLGPHGVGVVVFAHKSTSGWESLLQAMLDAGWIITASWPIDTERPGRLRAQGSAALASSVHLVCRPHMTGSRLGHEADVGDWRDVLAELPKRIREWMVRLSGEGVVGADAIFACLGPALEIFSRYSRVEKASGERVLLKEYLTYVWGAVAQEALAQIFKDADATGFEEDARLTAMWLWTLNAGAGNGVGSNGDADGDSEETPASDEEETASSGGKAGGYVLEFDAARKIAQGLGAHLEDLTGVIEVKGDKARLLSVGERTQRLFGKDEADAPRTKARRKDKQMKFGYAQELEAAEAEGGWGEKSVPKLGDTVLDRVHQSMILFAAGRGEAMKRFLVEDGAGRDQRFWKLAQALSALYPQGTDEKRWVDGVLARKKGLGL